MVIGEDEPRLESRWFWSPAGSERSTSLRLHDVDVDTPPGDATLVVMVDPTIAQELRSAQPGAGRADRLREILHAAGLRMDPLHADIGAHTGRSDGDLSSFFVITAPAGADVDRLAQELRSLPEVRAAYVKPHDQAP